MHNLVCLANCLDCFYLNISHSVQVIGLTNFACHSSVRIGYFALPNALLRDILWRPV